MTPFSGSILSQTVFIDASMFSQGPSVFAIFLGTRAPDCSSAKPLLTGWSGTKKSFSKIYPTKRQGSQPFKPRALASRQRDGKTNSPTGKRKTLIWDVKKEKTTGREHVLVSDSREPGFPKPTVTRFCGIHFFFLN